MYRLTLLGLLLALASIFNFWIADDKIWAGICFAGATLCFILHAFIQDVSRDIAFLLLLKDENWRKNHGG